MSISIVTSRLGVGLREDDPVGRLRELGYGTVWPVRVLSSFEGKDSRVVESEIDRPLEGVPPWLTIPRARSLSQVWHTGGHQWVYSYAFVQGCYDAGGDQVHTVRLIPSGLGVRGLCNTGERWWVYPYSAGRDLSMWAPVWSTRTSLSWDSATRVHTVVLIPSGLGDRRFCSTGEYWLL